MSVLDLPSMTCLNGSEKKAPNPNDRGPRFNAHLVNILFAEFFCFYIVKPAFPILDL